jgi:hypothetical protein
MRWGKIVSLPRLNQISTSHADTTPSVHGLRDISGNTPVKNPAPTEKLCRYLIRFQSSFQFNFRLVSHQELNAFRYNRWSIGLIAHASISGHPFAIANTFCPRNHGCSMICAPRIGRRAAYSVSTECEGALHVWFDAQPATAATSCCAPLCHRNRWPTHCAPPLPPWIRFWPCSKCRPWMKRSPGRKRRFNTSIITAFALGALLLATIGVYAVIGQSSGRPALGVAQARHCCHPEQSEEPAVCRLGHDIA